MLTSVLCECARQVGTMHSNSFCSSKGLESDIKPFRQSCLGLLVTSCQCPVCKLTLQAPLRMCENGHCVCQHCVDEAHNTPCPVCRAKLSNCKPKAFEHVLGIINCICRFASQGCMEFLDRSQKAEHELFCEYRTVDCFWCEWKNPLKYWVDHVSTTHGKTSVVTETHGTHLLLLGPEKRETFFLINGTIYVLHLYQRYKQPLQLSLQCYPTSRDDGDKIFSFSIENSGLNFSQSIRAVSDQIREDSLFEDDEKCITVPRYLLKNKEKFSFGIKSLRKVLFNNQSTW